MKIFRSTTDTRSDKPRIFTEQDSRAATVDQAKDSKLNVKIGIASLAVTATIGIASLASNWLPHPQQAEHPSVTFLQPSSDHPTISTTTEATPAATDEESSQTTSPASGCYDGATPTPCDSPHSREVFAKPDGSSCDTSALILHMGGIPDIDLLTSDIDVKALKDTEDRCVIERSSGMPREPLKDIWTSDNDHNGYKDGGQFRRCFNRQGQATSCDADHASEEFYDAPEEVDCGKKYEEFSGRPVDRNIRVTRQSRDHRIVCRAEVQVSTDRLTASVRDLGNSALPITQN